MSSEIIEVIDESKLVSVVNTAIGKITDEDMFWGNANDFWGEKGKDSGVRESELEENKRKAFWILPNRQIPGRFWSVLIDHNIAESETYLILDDIGQGERRPTSALKIDRSNKVSEAIKGTNLAVASQMTFDTLTRGKKVPLEKMEFDIVPAIMSEKFNYEEYKEPIVIDSLAISDTS